MTDNNEQIDIAAARIEAEMTDANKADWGQHPKQVKGGVFATSDIKLIKESLLFYTQHNSQLTQAETNQAASLLHRLNSRL